MSRQRQFKQFYQRPWSHKWLFLQAYVGLGIAWLAIHTLPFRWLSPRLGQRMAESSPEVAPEHLGFIQCVSWAVQRASELTPWPSVCLPQARVN